MITAFVMIVAAKQGVAELAEALTDIGGISEVYSVTGEFDVIAVLRVAEFDRVAELVTSEISKLPHVLDTRTHIAFRAYSRMDLEAMFSIGAD
ncbi:Lrp/AsnC family transcriptional regulator [Mycobacterium vicinigordonae]|uniref:Lrp/AsnC ligand binding domain-containing protein n=1 Tax=Mycobacterium vicinigordonae TaxID=1719132 RepID=A0A7D6DZ26_9MYCO|nr:Lrp/AsnC ligand binding domain-containing protein [Mycobacterium vicinigordonae]QLL07888.1 Lrp/AsnC ligand binding domain-containing protein [Mycobacterium vicinigordonae]